MKVFIDMHLYSLFTVRSELRVVCWSYLLIREELALCSGCSYFKLFALNSC